MGDDKNAAFLLPVIADISELITDQRLDDDWLRWRCCLRAKACLDANWLRLSLNIKVDQGRLRVKTCGAQRPAAFKDWRCLKIGGA